MVLEDWINKKLYVCVMFISMQILNLEEVSQLEFISNSANVSFPKVWGSWKGSKKFKLLTLLNIIKFLIFKNTVTR